MRLIILDNGNAINPDHMYAITVNHDEECIKVGLVGVPKFVTIYTLEDSEAYTTFVKNEGFYAPIIFLHKIVEKIYKELDEFNFNVNISSIEQHVIYDILDDRGDK